jgi:hypothetical protein
MRRKKVQFHKTLYNLQSKKKVLLILSLVSILKKISGTNLYVPSLIEIELYDQKQKKVVYDNKVKIEMFGLKSDN